ncbi:Ubiquitin-protein_ligase [Hexamita inflata]|uniref:HECT-type E3 ubiquitin transferase n=1 Tax=Hexamita inflata TaxID=28002 RepID=A0AA86QC08_9EUKA|nr:Ubiquitin-protein ligase [Hexamita inflata]CAI9950267.1 Ubiquitin-protein ligase [Hexamita inflata]
MSSLEANGLQARIEIEQKRRGYVYIFTYKQIIALAYHYQFTSGSSVDAFDKLIATEEYKIEIITDHFQTIMQLLLIKGYITDKIFPQTIEADEEFKCFCRQYKEVALNLRALKLETEFVLGSLHKITDEATFMIGLSLVSPILCNTHDYLWLRAVGSNPQLTDEQLFSQLCKCYSYNQYTRQNFSNKQFLRFLNVCPKKKLTLYTTKPLCKQQALQFYAKNQTPLNINEKYLQPNQIEQYQNKCQQLIRDFDTNLEDTFYNYPELVNQVQKQMLLRSNPYKFDTIEFYVTRDTLASDILSHFYQYSNISPANQKLQEVQLLFYQSIYVQFKQEDGVDAGGLTREVFPVLIRQMVTEYYWLFRQFHQFWFPDQTSMLDEKNLVDSCQLIGVVFGICLLNNLQIDDYFPNVFYQLLLTETLTFEQQVEYLMEIDPEFVQNMVKLLEFKDQEDLEDILCLNFTYVLNIFETPIQYDLIPDGENIAVNGQNVEQYVHLMIRQILLGNKNEEIFKNLRIGLRLVIPEFKLKFLTSQEMRFFLCGDTQIDFQQLKKITTYQWPYTEHTTIIKMFWEVLANMSPTKQKQFLKFMFSSPRVPPFGFKKFEIVRNGDANGYIVAHTCASILDLPEYQTIQELRKKLEFSIQFCEGFGVL